MVVVSKREGEQFPSDEVVPIEVTFESETQFTVSIATKSNQSFPAIPW